MLRESLQSADEEGIGAAGGLEDLAAALNGQVSLITSSFIQYVSRRSEFGQMPFTFSPVFAVEAWITGFRHRQREAIIFPTNAYCHYPGRSTTHLVFLELGGPPCFFW